MSFTEDFSGTSDSQLLAKPGWVAGVGTPSTFTINSTGSLSKSSSSPAPTTIERQIGRAHV